MKKLLLKREKHLSKTVIQAICIAFEFFLVFLCFVIILDSVRLNTKEAVLYADDQFVDEILYSEGHISVNNVNVTVPSTEGTLYSISYAWGKNDDKFPTVPQSVTASYPADDGTSKYNITLYRESLTPNKDIPAGKNLSNWFSGWSTIENEFSKQLPKIYGNIKGFLITTIGSDTESAYESSSFYFPVKTDDGISVYVIEGLLYDQNYTNEFSMVMENTFSSVVIHTDKEATLESTPL